MSSLWCYESRTERVSLCGSILSCNKIRQMKGLCMQYAIELYFDPKTEEKLWELPRKIAAEHISTKYLEWKPSPPFDAGMF